MYWSSIIASYLFFFFQAEDGIRDDLVTGVQTCALPISLPETTFRFARQNGNAVDLKLLDDYVTNNESHTESADIDAPIVFVGYGIEAPEYKWDDYKGADLRGKVLLMLVNEPPSEDPNFFKGKALTYYGRWTYKYRSG